MECFICVNEFLSSKIFFSSPVRKNNFPFEKYRYTESRRCYFTKKKEFFFRRQKWPIEADNEQFNLVGSRILRRDKFIRHKFGAIRLLLLFPSFLFSNRRNRDCSTWLYDNIFDIESIRGNRGSVLRASFIGKHTIG